MDETKCYSNFIKVSKTYSRSVNIKYDWDNYNKISSFVPTLKSAEIINEIIESLNNKGSAEHKRANIMVGSYGTGKSHLTLLLSYLLRHDTNKSKCLKPVIEKIKNISPTLVNKLEKLFDKKYLVVNISGTIDSLDRLFISSLKEALNREGLERKVHLKTKFNAAINLLINWQKNYPHQLAKVIEHFNDESYSKKKQTLADIIEKLETLDSKTFDLFLEVYSKVTFGAKFDESYDTSIADIYNEAALKIKKEGYEGIFVIFDEFGKYFEKASNKSNYYLSSNLQDFAELCNKSASLNINLLLITHQEITHYTNNLTNEQKNEWIKVEGRFNHLLNIDNSGKIYEMISSIITNTDNATVEKVNKAFSNKLEKYDDVFSGLINKDNLLTILSKCFPIEPCCLFALPFLSNKLAQSERTIFTFICNDEENSFQSFLSSSRIYETNIYRSIFDCAQLYDYFEELIKKDNKLGGTHIVWKKVQAALQKIVHLDKPDKLEKIIKTIAVIMIVNEYKQLPPTRESLELALNMGDELDEYLHLLADNKVLIMSVKNGHYRFIEGSNVDIVKEMNHYRDEDVDVYNILNEKFMPPLCIPKQHNELNCVNRFLVCYFGGISKIKDFADPEIIKKELYAKKCDGLILYCIAETEDDLKLLLRQIKHNQSLAETNSILNLVAYIVPSASVYLSNNLANYYSLLKMIDDKELTDRDELVSKEIAELIDDYYNLIEEQLRKVFFDYTTEKRIFNNYLDKNAHFKYNYHLNQLTSKIFDQIYTSTPKINYELVNKNYLSVQMETAFKNIFKEFINCKRPVINLTFTRKSAEVSILKCVYKINNLINFVNNDKQIDVNFINFDEDNTISPKLVSCLNIIIDFFQESIKPRNFIDLYNNLKSSPFGLKDGIIAYLLLYVFKYKNIIHSVFIKSLNEDGNFEYVNNYDGELILSLVKNPENYQIEFSNNIFENFESANDYLYRLLKLNRIANFVSDDNKDIYNRITVALSNWYFSIPKYVREYNYDGNSLEYNVINLIKTSRTNSKKFLLYEIPQMLKMSSGKSKKLNFDETLKKLEDILDNYSSQIDVLRSKIIDKTKEISIDKFKNKSLDIEGLHSLNSILSHIFKMSTLDLVESEETINAVNKISNFIVIKNQSDVELVNFISKLLTGLSIIDWNLQTENEFYDKFILLLDDLSGLKIKSSNKQSIKLNLVDPDNNIKVSKTFSDVEISSMGEIAKSNLKSVLDDFNQSISLNEKRKILLSIFMDSYSDEIEDLKKNHKS